MDARFGKSLQYHKKGFVNYLKVPWQSQENTVPIFIYTYFILVRKAAFRKLALYSSTAGQKGKVF